MMTDGSRGSKEANLAVEEGIQLALDPNLISLPHIGSATSPQPVATTTNSADADTSRPGSVKTGDNQPQDFLTDKLAHSQALFKNPYEIFGQMPMQQLVPLLLQQRGPGFKFADLSEEGLLNEIDSNQDNLQQHADDKSQDSFPILGQDEDSLMTDEASSKPKPEEDSQLDLQQKEESGRISFENEAESITQEQFVSIRRSMIEHINLALNESSLALEFLSLLLSSVRESAATASMSPFLKKTAPVGSLNSDKVPLVPNSVEETQSAEILSRGWKLRSLNESRTLLKEKYMVLNDTIAKEHRYWINISKHISNKDVIFKMRDKNSGERLLGIKYGYEDSGSTFRHDRGMAVLRNNPEQDKLELVPSPGADAISSSHTERFVRVRIYTKIASEDDYILTGESALSKLFSNVDGGTEDNSEDVKNQIKRLKAFAFEHELMFQLKKESSLLISYGVTVENENKVVIELPNEKFEFELVSLDDDSVINHVQDAPKVNDKRATLTLTVLRLLLIAMFKKNLKQRLTSSSKVSRSAKDILLLRPLLGRLRHHNYRILLRKIVKDYILDVTEHSTLNETSVPYPASPVDNELDVNVAKLTGEINAFRGLVNISKTKFEIDLSDKGKLTLVLESPNYCNAVVRITYSNATKGASFDTNFSEFKEIEEFLHFIFIEYIKDKESVKDEN